MLKPRRALLTWGAVSPRAAMRSGSMMTLISRFTPPTREICDTPFSVWSSRAMVSSMNQESSESDMAGAATA